MGRPPSPDLAMATPPMATPPPYNTQASVGTPGLTQSAPTYAMPPSISTSPPTGFTSPMQPDLLPHMTDYQQQTMTAPVPGTMPMMISQTNAGSGFQQPPVVAPTQMSMNYQHPNSMSPERAYGLPQYSLMPPNVIPKEASSQSEAQTRREYLTAIPIPALGPGPAPVDCPVCGQRRLTNIRRVAGEKTHLWAIILCLLCGLPCIPYLIPSMKNVDHRCGGCGILLATYQRGGGTVAHQHA